MFFPWNWRRIDKWGGEKAGEMARARSCRHSIYLLGRVGSCEVFYTAGRHTHEFISATVCRVVFSAAKTESKGVSWEWWPWTCWELTAWTSRGVAVVMDSVRIFITSGTWFSLGKSVYCWNCPPNMTSLPLERLEMEFRENIFMCIFYK